jgi:hypothetical protein
MLMKKYKLNYFEIYDSFSSYTLNMNNTDEIEIIVTVDNINNAKDMTLNTKSNFLHPGPTILDFKKQIINSNNTVFRNTLNLFKYNAHVAKYFNTEIFHYVFPNNVNYPHDYVKDKINQNTNIRSFKNDLKQLCNIISQHTNRFEEPKVLFTISREEGYRGSWNPFSGYIIYVDIYGYSYQVITLPNKSQDIYFHHN